MSNHIWPSRSGRRAPIDGALARPIERLDARRAAALSKYRVVMQVSDALTKNAGEANVEVCQAEINRKQGTKLNTAVTYYGQLVTVAYGGTPKEAGLDGHVIALTRLQKIASKGAK